MTSFRCYEARCHHNTDHKKFPSLSYKAVVAIGQIFVYAQNWEVKSLKNPLEPPKTIIHTRTEDDNKDQS